MSERIRTPVSTRALVDTVRKAGYIEKPENFPVVAEIDSGFLFVFWNDNCSQWIVSKYFTGTANSYLAQPLHSVDEFETAVALLGHEYTLEISNYA